MREEITVIQFTESGYRPLPAVNRPNDHFDNCETSLNRR